MMGVPVAFDPISGEHAISEVVFGLTFSRPFAPHELDRVAKSHNEWQDELPRLSRTGGGFEIVFGQVGAPLSGFPTVVGGVSFERIKPDGTLDWRVLVDQNNVFINCLSYTRWADVWPRAREYIKRIIQIAGASENLVSGSILQYVDIFRWTAERTSYNLSEILSAGDHVPRSLFDKGHLWHLHQGWFELDENGRILERIHIDGVEDQNSTPIVKLDTYMHHQLATFYTQSEAVNNGWLESTFDSMHNKNKWLLGSFITPQLAKRIKLNVE